MNYIIDTMHAGDWPEAAEIFRQGIEKPNCTLREGVPSWEQWDEGHTAAPRLVARDGEHVVGWAALSPISDRCCYRGVAEVSIYIHNDYAGRGIGSLLLKELVEQAEAEGFWTLESKIIEGNAASIAIHQKCGFEIVGVRKRLGKREGGEWKNVVLMEYRSEINGID